MFVNDIRYDHIDTLSIDKASLNSFRQMVPGGLANHTLAPATMHDALHGDTMWLVEGAGGNSDARSLLRLQTADPCRVGILPLLVHD
jgi:hypothetical protein